VTDEKIAALAAVEDKKLEAPPVAKAPEPTPALEIKNEPAPVAQPKVERSALGWQVFPFAGALVPTGSFADVTKPALNYGIGGGRALFDVDGKVLRGNILLAHSVLPPKDSGLSGDLNITLLSLRTDYLWNMGPVKPFIGLGLGLYLWDGAITQTASGASHEKSTKDSGVSVAAGLDTELTQGLSLSPELSWNKAGGAFSASFLTVNLALRWDL
jgi:opacity protein-like surface antigen